VSVTGVPLVNASEQVLPHEMPAGLEETEPLPPLVTLSVNVWVKVALTLWLALMLSEQVPVPALAQSPPQPVNA
jgi:hypothetical protein